MEVANLPNDVNKGFLQCVVQLDYFDMKTKLNTGWVFESEEFLL